MWATLELLEHSQRTFSIIRCYMELKCKQTLLDRLLTGLSEIVLLGSPQCLGAEKKHLNGTLTYKLYSHAHWH